MPVIDAPSVVWIAVAIIAAVIEVTIPQFGVIFVSLAALSAAVPAWLGFGPVTQIAVFVVVLLAFFRAQVAGNRAVRSAGGGDSFHGTSFTKDMSHRLFHRGLTGPTGIDQRSINIKQQNVHSSSHLSKQSQTVRF